MSQPVEFLSSVGRIVWGHPLNAQPKKDNKKQNVMKDGKQVMQWAFGLAIDKASFSANEWPNLHRAASMLFPNGVPPQFSWKYKDGDGVDRKGKPYSLREGHAGHYILTISTEAFAPQFFKREGNGFRQIEPHEIKCGDYVRVTIVAKANAPTDPTHTPGLYINPKGGELVGYGTEIVSGGIDPDEAFATPVAQLPLGASATPIASTGGAMPPGMVSAPQSYAPPAGAPPMQQQQPPMATPQQYAAPAPQSYAPPAQQQYAAPGQMPPPAHDFVQNAGAPQGYAPPMQQQQPPMATPQQYAAPGMPGNAPVANAGVPSPASAYAPPTGYAPGATSYPSNGAPGMPGVPQR